MIVGYDVIFCSSDKRIQTKASSEIVGESYESDSQQSVSESEQPIYLVTVITIIIYYKFFLWESLVYVAKL